MRETWLIVLVGVAVLLAASLSYLLSVRGIVTVWIPSGVLLGFLISLENRQWPAALAGGYAGNLVADLLYVANPRLALVGPVGNIIEALLAATVIRWLMGRRNLLVSLRGIGALVLGAALVSNALTAVLGGAILIHWYPQPFLFGWLNWWVGDGLGMVVVTPAILGLIEGQRLLLRQKPTWTRLMEGAALFAAVLVSALLAFDQAPGFDRFLASTYLVFPFLILIALRLGPAAAAAAVCLLASVALWFSALGRGPLVNPLQSPLDSAVNVYAFLALASVAVLVPAAAIAERAEAAERVQASEARYRALVETARDAIITISANGRIRFSNPAVEQIFGYEPGALTGRPVMNLIPAPQRAWLEAAFRRYLSGEQPAPWRGIQLTALHREGHEVPVEFAFGEWVADGERLFTGIVRDISERKQLEEDLRHSQKLEALGQLTGGVAHEFRNELTVILANAELALTDTSPGHAQRSALEEIRDAASRGAALTRDLLAFGRRQSLQPVTLDLDEVVARSVATVRSVLGRGIVVEATRVGGGKQIHADPTVLQQALLNLVLNARDAMPEGGRLTLRTAVTELDAAHAERLGLAGAGRHVMLEVSDTGVGMDPATLSRVFEPFFTTKPKGTGLGLATVYGIVRQSGGAIQVESTLGEGTTFRIYFPETAETPLVEVT